MRASILRWRPLPGKRRVRGAQPRAEQRVESVKERLCFKVLEKRNGNEVLGFSVAPCHLSFQKLQHCEHLGLGLVLRPSDVLTHKAQEVAHKHVWQQGAVVAKVFGLNRRE